MGQRWTNSGELVETDSGGGLFQNIFGKGKDLIKAVIASKYPEVSNLLSGENSTLPGNLPTDIGSNEWMNRDTEYSANQTSSDYQPTSGYDPNFFNQNTNTTQDYIDRDTGYDTEVFPSTQFDSQEDIDSKATTQVEDYNKRFEIENTKTTEEAPVVDDEEEEPINDMLGYAMRNRFGGWGGPTGRAYQIPMMKTAQRGLKY